MSKSSNDMFSDKASPREVFKHLFSFGTSGLVSVLDKNKNKMNIERYKKTH